MEYMQVFDISASGMDYQRTRMDVIATNIANAYSTRNVDGHLFKPLKVVATSGANDFSQLMGIEANGTLDLVGVENFEVLETNTKPRLSYEPGHPDANEDGFVAYPGVKPVTAMTDLISASRAFEANVRVMNAARSMALRALEIGRSS